MIGGVNRLSSWIGKSVKRTEDKKLLTGKGQFVADMKREGMLHACFLRSTEAHALIAGIDTAKARGLPGVVGVWTAEELEGLGYVEPMGVLPAGMHEISRLKRREWSQPPLAGEKTRFAGEPIAVVLAENRYIAEDAVELIEVSYVPLQPVVTMRAALESSGPKLFDEWPDNIQAEFVIEKGDWKRAFLEADVVVEGSYSVGRITGIPMECRGIMAEIDEDDGRLTVWSATQIPYDLRGNLAKALGCASEEIRVAAPDVGGGFGIKDNVYPEELVVPYLAKKLRRPVKWIEDRTEHLLTASHARDQQHRIRAAFRKDGTLLGIEDEFYVDCGAYNLWETCVAYNTASSMSGPYRCPALFYRAYDILTNKTPAAPYRGAGRPEAVFVLERLLDESAKKLGIDRMELRRKNMIQGDEFPYDAGILYRDQTRMVYDSGNFSENFDKLMDQVDYAEFLREQQRLREEGKYIGLGVANFVEGTGVGPYEKAVVSVLPDGTVRAATGAASQGQGHKTTFAQVCAQALELDLDQIDIIEGDTGIVPDGIGTFASRSAVVAGNAIYAAGIGLKARIIELAAERLLIDPKEAAYERGTVYSVRNPDHKIRLKELADACGDDLTVSNSFHPGTTTYASGAHAVLAEVEPATGKVTIKRYWAVHDTGKQINPKVVTGQIIGAMIQGIGSALMEEIQYGEEGRLKTPTLKEYLVPSIFSLPPIELHKVEYPSTRNTLGLKGTGEAGIICAAAAVAGAVADALEPFRAEIREIPMTPARVREAVKNASPLTIN
ncbi:hypothetical protein VN24_01230 [Paenibacillus beijingensis]|uniref:Aldehyde oxidase/xanthine dehydrogenase a/b hammerhead domain-containing protein n=1 Tax=Paenibacillus beijingensis TaxID=1126833 RepID=A0A0D5NR60_9BACL|nr:hypothetical protein VN24_01230 [Paenibacillus beijingensis]